jgi:class 3 adenylate cyclase/tetratricopeptide (TPR) repeat protein
MAVKCPQCGAGNEPGEKFCGECGTTLSTSSQPPTAAAQAAPAVRVAAEDSGAQLPDGERKTVTALFADIKGSMELMEDLDPEEARAIVDPALKLMIDAVHRYDGYIVQSTGDGIFALFGAPVAREDHPQRALYAALRMQEDLRRYSASLREGGNLAVEARVGVNTGEVVVRSIKTDDTHAEYTPIGHSTSLAARMQALAPTGSIATTEQTRHLCEGYFSFKALGPTRIKGVSEPVNVVEVTGLGPLRTRLQLSAQRGLTKFVGRQAELEQMKHALELACAGHGQVVAAMGEPGVGKSRLVLEFKAIAQAGCLVLETFSVSHGKASAYLPVIDLLKNYFKISVEDDERTRREKIAGKLVILDRTLEDALPYVYSLLDISEGDDLLAQFDPQTRRQRTLQAVKRILTRESLNQPLILVFEDLHWIDSETQALLNLLVEGIATSRILLLVNYRPEYRHQWGNKTYYTQLRLDPLGKDSAAEMLIMLIGDGESLAPARRLIIERTEGNPFFMEEMVQALFEQGALVRNGAVKLAKQLDEIRVPPTVQAILASRIDRLAAAEKELLQTLAVLGREFALGLVRRMTAKAPDELERILLNLHMGEFIYEQPTMGDIEYQFKHALTQEVAYDSVLTQRRRSLHERAAQAIEALYADRLEDYLASLANHYDRSGNVRKAIEYLGQSGARAAQQVAYSEAVGHFTRALELLKQLPESTEFARQELDLLLALDWPFTRTRGSSGPEREAMLNRMRELSERLGDSLGLLKALVGLAMVQAGQNLLEAREQMGMALARAESADAPAVLADAHIVMGVVLLASGAFGAAREHLERGLEAGEEVALRHTGRGAPGVLANVLLLLGYPETAQRKSQQFLTASRQLSDPAVIDFALFHDTFVHFRLRDSRAVAERAEELLSIGNDLGSLFDINQRNFSKAGQSRHPWTGGESTKCVKSCHPCR